MKYYGLLYSIAFVCEKFSIDIKHNAEATGILIKQNNDIKLAVAFPMIGQGRL